MGLRLSANFSSFIIPNSTARVADFFGPQSRLATMRAGGDPAYLSASVSADRFTVNEEHLETIRGGVDNWNAWRLSNKETPCLVSTDLSGMNLDGIQLSDAYLRNANLEGSRLCNASLNRSDFYGSNLRKTDLSNSLIFGGDFRESNCEFSVFDKSDLRSCTFQGSDLTGSSLVNCNFEGAMFIDVCLNSSNLDGSRIYGASIWNAEIDDETSQRDLVITKASENTVTVSDINAAQFTHMILQNRNFRKFIDSVVSKIVVILGRFTEKQLVVLNAVKAKLSTLNFVPVVFDFDKPESRDTTETVSTLAHLAQFTIVDITDPRSVPQELQKIVPSLPSVPIKPIIEKSSTAYGMFADFAGYRSVLPPFEYESLEVLLRDLDSEVVAPSIVRAAEILDMRRRFGDS